jgi:hypothetical protein
VQTYYLSDTYNIKLIQSLGPNSTVVTTAELFAEENNRIELAPIQNIALGVNYSRLCSDNIELHNADFILSLESNLSENTDSHYIREKINLGLEKNYLAITVRHTLGALRSLRTDIKTQANANNFVEYIGNIFEVAESSSLASTVSTIFKSRIENNTFESIAENITYIESQLFELKNNLKLIAIYLENAIVVKSHSQTTQA